MNHEALYTVAVDLAQKSDYTAISIIEQQVFMSGWQSPSTIAPAILTHALRRDAAVNWPQRPPLHLRHLERMREQPYPHIVSHVLGICRRPLLIERGFHLVIDATGVGAPVVDMFRQAGLAPIAITIHGGDRVSNEGRNVRVPKRDLVAALQSVMQTERLRVSPSLPLAPVFAQEALNFRVTIDPRTAHDSYSAWREADHDDLVLSVAMGVWWRDTRMKSVDQMRMTRGLVQAWG